jgi:hypothetical protein
MIIVIELANTNSADGEVAASSWALRYWWLQGQQKLAGTLDAKSSTTI